MTTSHPNPSEEHDDLGHLVVRLSRQLRKRRARSLEPFGLVAHQARAFMVVARASDRASELRLSDLAAKLHIAPRSATEVVDALEAKSLVERQPCSTDRRATQVALTSVGRDLRQQIEQSRADRDDDVFGDLSEADRSTLARLLRHAIASAEQDQPDE